MVPGGPLGRRSASLALWAHFLFEARLLDLLPAPLARAVGDLAASVEAAGRDLHRPLEEVADVLSEFRAALGLDEHPWPPPQRYRSALSAALAQCRGEGGPQAAAERLGRLCESLAQSQRDPRSTGTYYTPGWLARHIARTAVSAVLVGRRDRSTSALSLRLLDPAAGAGAFALAAVEALAGAAGEERPDAAHIAARECVWAVESDALGARACRLAVWLGASRPGLPAVIPASHIRVGDSLATPPESRSFDIVIGNPPWGVKLTPKLAGKLAEKAPAALSGHRDSFLFFLLHAADSVRDDGAVAMLLPDALLSQVRYQRARQFLLMRFRPVQVALLGGRVFPRATAPACLLCLAGRPIASRSCSTADLRRVPRSELQAAISHMAHDGPADAPERAPHHSFLAAPEWLSALLHRLTARLPAVANLPGVEFRDVGVNYPRAEVGRAILYTGQQERAEDIPIVRGRDFAAFTRIGHSAWLRHDWPDRLRPGDRASVRSAVYRTAPKLLFRQTGDRPVATLDTNGAWFGRSVIAVTCSQEDDPLATLLWLCALLNSRALAALYRAVAPEAGRSFAQVKVSKLKVLPAPTTGRRELAGLAAALLGETTPSARPRVVAELDAAVYRAYGLRRAEIARIEGIVPPCIPARSGAGLASARPAPPAATWPAKRPRPQSSSRRGTSGPGSASGRTG